MLIEIHQPLPCSHRKKADARYSKREQTLKIMNCQNEEEVLVLFENTNIQNFEKFRFVW
jgi:hypothetical protein